MTLEEYKNIVQLIPQLEKYRNVIAKMEDKIKSKDAQIKTLKDEKKIARYIEFIRCKFLVCNSSPFGLAQCLE